MHSKVYNHGYPYVYLDLITGLWKRKKTKIEFEIYFRGCLHSYISYLDDACDVCLVLLTVNPEHFQILANFKQIIGDVNIFLRQKRIVLCSFLYLEIKKIEFNQSNISRSWSRSNIIRWYCLQWSTIFCL